MAEDQDDASKTEEPSAKRLDEAQKKGQVVQSKDVGNFMMLLSGILVVAMLGPGLTRDVGALVRTFLERPHQFHVDDANFMALLGETLMRLGFILFLPFLVFVVVAIAAHVLQHGLVWSAESIQPNLSKISPLAGAKRLFGLQNFVEFIKGLIKISVVGAICFAVLWPPMSGVEQFMTMESYDLMVVMFKLTIRLVAVALFAILIIAILDYIFQRFEFMKKMRMTKQEVKDEYKQSEGDPHVKARLKQLRAEKARRRMMTAVPGATVVVTNPTHFAVALLYDQSSMNAPKVVAKGADLIALRIRQVAEENDVPIVENPPLARTLFAAVDLDREIHEEHYKAVAEVIGYVMRLRRGQAFAYTASPDSYTASTTMQ